MLDYRQLLDLYDRIGPSTGQGSVADFSKYMNREYETDIFNEGLDSNPIRESSVRFTDWLGNSPVGDFASEQIGNLATSFGLDRKVGEDVGRSLPRQGVDFAPAIAGPLIGGGIGSMVGGAPGAVAGTGIGYQVGMPVSAGLSAWNTYGETGSVPAALISGAVQYAMPGIGKAGGTLASKLLGTGGAAGIDVLGTQVAKTIQRPITEGLVELAGEAGLQTLAGEFGGIASNTAARMDRGDQDLGTALGGTLKDYATKENAFQTIVGELPFFVGMDLPQKLIGKGVTHAGEVLRTEAEMHRYQNREEAVDKVKGLFDEVGIPSERDQINSFLDEYLGRGEDINQYSVAKIDPEEDLLALPGPYGLEGVKLADDVVINRQQRPVVLGKDTRTPPRTWEENWSMLGQLDKPLEVGPAGAATDSLPVELSPEEMVVSEKAVLPKDIYELENVGKVVQKLGLPPEEIVEKGSGFFAAQQDALADEVETNPSLKVNFDRFTEKGYEPLEALERAVKATIQHLPETRRVEFEGLMARPEEMTGFDNLVKKSADVVASKRGANFSDLENLLSDDMDSVDAFVETNREALDEIAAGAFGADYQSLDPVNQTRVLDNARESGINERIRDASRQLMGLARVAADPTMLATAVRETGGYKIAESNPVFKRATERVQRLLPFIFGQTESLTKNDKRLRQMQMDYHAKFGETPSVETLRKDANAAIRYFQDFYKQVGIEDLYQQLPSKAEQDSRPKFEQAVQEAVAEYTPPVDEAVRVRGEFDKTFADIQQQRPEDGDPIQDIPARQDEDTDADEGAYAFQVLKLMVNSMASRFNVPTEDIWKVIGIGHDMDVEGEPGLNAGGRGVYHNMLVEPETKTSGYTPTVATRDGLKKIAGHYILLTRAANADTVAHEGSHLYSVLLEAAAQGENASAQVKADYQALREFAEMKEGQTFLDIEDPRGPEIVAEAFMKYLQTGQAPTSKLKAVFDRLKEWFRETFLYLKKDLTPQIQEVFGRWLTEQGGEFDQATRARKEREASKQGSLQTAKAENILTPIVDEEVPRTREQEIDDEQVKISEEDPNWQTNPRYLELQAEMDEIDRAKVRQPRFAKSRSPESAKRAAERDLAALSETQKSVGTSYYTHGINEGLSPKDAAKFAATATKIAGAINPTPLKYGALPDRAKSNFLGIFMEGKMGRIAGQFFTRRSPHTDYMVMAHEVSHALHEDYKYGRLPEARKQQFDKVQTLANNLDEGERGLILRELYDALVPSDAKLGDVITSNMDDPNEFIASLLGITAMGSTSPSAMRGVKESVKFLPKEIENFTKGVYRDIFEYSDAIASKIQNPILSKRFKELAEATQGVLRPDPEAKRLDAQIDELVQSDPETFASILADGQTPSGMETLMMTLGVKGSQFLRTDDPKGKLGVGAEPNVYQRNFQAFWQLAKVFPGLQVIEDLARSHREVAHYYRSKLFKPLSVGKTKAGETKYVEPDFKSLRRISHNEQANKIYNNIQRKQNSEKRLLDDKELNDAMRGLNPEMRSLVGSATRNFAKANLEAANTWRAISRDRIAITAATALQGLHTERAKSIPGYKIPSVGEIDKIAKTFIESQIDPTKAPTSIALMSADPEAANIMAKVWMSLKPKYDALDETLKSNPGYSPEATNNFSVSYQNKSGVRVVLSGDTEKEHQKNLATARADKERNSPFTIETPGSKREENVGSVQNKILEAYNSIEQDAFAAALETIKDPAARSEFQKEYAPGTAASRWAAAQTMNKHLLRRRGNKDDKGTFDYLTSNIRYLNNLSFFGAKDYVNARKPLYLNDAKLRADPNLVNLASAHINNVLNPLSPTVGKLNGLNFMYWLGFNPSSAIMDLTQSIFVSVPNLIRRGAGIGESYRTIGKASKLALSSWGQKTTGDKELDKVITRAYDTGIIDRKNSALFGDELEHLEHSVFNFAGPSDGVSLGSLMKNGWYYFNKASRFFYENSGEFNSKVGLISGYLQAKRQNPKASFDELFDAARTFNQESNFGGGAAARPVFKDVDSAVGRNARGLAYSLSHYTTSMYGLYVLRGMEAIGRLPISSEDRRAAKHSLAVMAGSQALAGGAVGLPLVGSIFAIINNLTGFSVEDEVKDWLKENVGDAKQGALYGSLLMNGLGSYAGPLDVSGRVGLGTVLGVDNYGDASVLDVMGPTVNLAQTYMDQYSKWQQGDLSTSQAAVTLLPNGIRRVLQAGLDGGAVRGPQGKLTYQPDAGERLALAAGFQPRKLTEQRREVNQQRQAATARNAELKRWRSQLADLYDPNNPESAYVIQSEVMERRKAELSLDPSAELRQISQIIANRTLPDDPRRLGPKQNDRRVPSLPRMSEVERYLYEKQVEQSLNPTSRGPSERQVQKLQGVDYIVEKYGLSSPQANAVVDLVDMGYDEQTAVESVTQG